MVDGGSDPCKFPDTGNGYFQSIGGLDISWATGVIGTVVEDDGIVSEGGDGTSFKEVIYDTVGAARDERALNRMIVL